MNAIKNMIKFALESIPILEKNNMTNADFFDETKEIAYSKHS